MIQIIFVNNIFTNWRLKVCIKFFKFVNFLMLLWVYYSACADRKILWYGGVPLGGAHQTQNKHFDKLFLIYGYIMFLFTTNNLIFITQKSEVAWFLSPPPISGTMTSFTPPLPNVCALLEIMITVLIIKNLQFKRALTANKWHINILQ